MKKQAVLLMSGLIIMAGCSKEDSLTVSDSDQKKVPVNHNMTVMLSFIPDFSLPQMECTPENSHVFLVGGGSLTGTVSEIGNAIVSESKWSMESCGMIEGQDQLKQVITGKITSLTGDYMKFTGVISIDLSSDNLHGNLYLDGGSGKFTNCSGRVQVDGAVIKTTSRFTWSGAGTITLWI